MLDRVERQTLALQGQYTVLKASGNFDVQHEWPSLEAAQDNLDAWLEASPHVLVRDEYDELLELVGVGRG